MNLVGKWEIYKKLIDLFINSIFVLIGFAATLVVKIIDSSDEVKTKSETLSSVAVTSVKKTL